MEAVGIAQEAVAGVDPAPLTHGLRRFVGSVPVYWRVSIAAHPHNAFFIVADLAAVLVLQEDFVAGNAQARRAEFFLLGAVGEIDVQHFGRTEPLDSLESG